MIVRKLAIAATIAASLTLSAASASAQSYFIRGDANNNGAVNLSDALAILNYQFVQGTTPACLDAADFNDSGTLTLGDPIGILNFQFLGGVAPKAPYPYVDGDPTPGDDLTCKPNIIDVEGTLTADETWTAGNTYRLIGGVFVDAGVTLTINAGVTVLGATPTEVGGPKALLCALRGTKDAPSGRIVAVGTATRPIIFTSDKDVGERAPQDWGGVLLIGRGRNNWDAGESTAEGLTGVMYGGGNPDGDDDLDFIDDDDSGHLSYVRVEFGGFPLLPNVEVNGLGMYSSGSGTIVDHVCVKKNADDAFEWFGGATNLKYGLALSIQDDSFDYSFGFTGKGQFWLAQQNGEGERGFEVDNHETASEYLNEPIASPTISNFTLIGSRTAGTLNNTGLFYRRGAGGLLYNGIVQNWPAAGFDIDNAENTVHSADVFTVDYCAFYDNGEDLDGGVGPLHVENCENDDTETAPFEFTSCEFLFTNNVNNTEMTTNPLTDPYDLDAPDFRPVAGNPAPLDPTTIDPFFDAADYIGAVDPDADWTHEPWISYLLE